MQIQMEINKYFETKITATFYNKRMLDIMENLRNSFINEVDFSNMHIMQLQTQMMKLRRIATEEVIITTNILKYRKNHINVQ